jgi:C4-dicarboxylate transporter, DctM subunit
MGPEILGIIGLILALLMIAMGVHIAMALGGVAVIGLILLTGFVPAVSQITLSNWVHSTSSVMACIPLFILMGELMFHSRIAGDLYYAAYRWMGNLPGGMAIASSFSCAAFGSISGSSVATVGTIGRIAIPEMKKYNYDIKLAAGCLAASGTMGSQIPPSIQLILYGMLTEESIGRLFIAGLIPGIIEAVSYSAMILVLCSLNPNLGPRAPHFRFREKLSSLKFVAPILALFILVLGGIYTGIFTPTEAAGVGAFLAFVITLVMHRMTIGRIKDSLLGTGRITAMVMALILGGLLFSHFLVASGLAEDFIDLSTSVKTSPYYTLIGILILYFFLGMVLNVTSMIVLTVPLLYPVIIELGFDGIWFGIIVVQMAEVAAITPPIGANVYVMHTIAPDVSIETIFRGIIPFATMDIFNLVIFLIFPQVVLFLPNMMY